jgi:hypothetical protein
MVDGRAALTDVGKTLPQLAISRPQNESSSASHCRNPLQRTSSTGRRFLVEGCVVSVVADWPTQPRVAVVWAVSTVHTDGASDRVVIKGRSRRPASATTRCRLIGVNILLIVH